MVYIIIVYFLFTCAAHKSKCNTLEINVDAETTEVTAIIRK